LSITITPKVLIKEINENIKRWWWERGVKSRLNGNGILNSQPPRKTLG